MPSSPRAAERRTSAPDPPRSVMVRTASSTTDDELLHLIESARSAVARARDAAADAYALSSSSDSAAAEASLFERHAHRRAYELEWDERDTARRARELMASLDANPPPNDLVDLDDDSDDDLTLAPFEPRPRPRPAFALPETDDDDNDDQDEDEEEEYPDEAIFGFDGAGTGDELEDEFTVPAATWPRLLAEHPLNPSDDASLRVAPAVPPSTDSRSPRPAAAIPSDPSSSTSFTSFLAPGSTFHGQQVTNQRRPTRRTSSSRGPAAERTRRSNDASSDANRPAFATHARSAAAAAAAADRTHDASNQNPYGFYIRPNAAHAYLLGPLRPTSSFTAYAPSPSPSPSSRPIGSTIPDSASASASASSSSSTRPPTSTSARYAPYSAHTATTGPASTVSAAALAPVPPNLTPVERARYTIARTANPAARSNPASWREVADELLVRLSRNDDADEDEVMADRGDARVRGRDEERWDVQVNIETYDPIEGRLTGLMSAYGIQSSVRDLTSHPSRVTTFFSASIVRPLVSGLFVSPSPTGSVGGNDGIRVSQSTEAEAWIEVGPFKGMKKHDLMASAQDRRWVEQKSRGWVLMRWKERDFVNVKATESSLSINGFYFVALDRTTGVIEGLYSDPASSPHQRLDLSPCTLDGAFSLGQYSMR